MLISGSTLPLLPQRAKLSNELHRWNITQHSSQFRRAGECLGNLGYGGAPHSGCCQMAVPGECERLTRFCDLPSKRKQWLGFALSGRRSSLAAGDQS
jgi:hypothetical protein